MQAPTLVDEDRGLLLSMVCDDDGRERSVKVLFVKPRAFRKREEIYCTEWHVTDTYDTVCEVKESEWVAELRNDAVSEWRDYWELGPGRNAPNALIFSPGGDRDLLAETRAIVQLAPNIAGWEFLPAKPVKEWQLLFEIEDSQGRPVSVDASKWRYVLLRHSDGEREVLVEVANLQGLADDYQRWAAEIVLDGMLGEQKRIETIDAVCVVEKFDAKLSLSAKPITGIAHHVEDAN